ncbi:organic solute transporter subunit alpha-like [Glandiceps talaboti]
MSVNSNDSCKAEPPPVDEYLGEIQPYGILILSLESVILVFSWLILLETYINVRTGSFKERNSILIVVALYPIFILASYISVFVPRTSSATMPAASMYLSFVLYHLIHIIENYFGGRDNFFQVMSKQKVSLVGFPICFIFCLPTITMTGDNISRLRCGIYQYIIVRPLFYYVMLLIQSTIEIYPSRYDKNLPYVYIIFTINLSTIMAMYCIGIFTTAIKEHLPNEKIPAKFFCVRVVLLTTIFQETILSILTTYDIIPCAEKGPMASQVRALWINNNLLIFELFLILLLVRYLYRTTRADTSGYLPLRDDNDNDGDNREESEKISYGDDDDHDKSIDENTSLLHDNSSTRLIV